MLSRVGKRNVMSVGEKGAVVSVLQLSGVVRATVLVLAERCWSWVLAKSAMSVTEKAGMKSKV